MPQATYEPYAVPYLQCFGYQVYWLVRNKYQYHLQIRRMSVSLKPSQDQLCTVRTKEVQEQREPCGTTYLISKVSEILPQTESYCFLSVRYDLNSEILLIP